MSTLKQLVEKRLEELGMGSVEAATSVGVQRNFLRDILLEKKHSVRSDKMPELAKALRMPVSELARELGMPAGQGETRMVTVAAHVQAGDWAETWEWADDDQYSVGIPADEAMRSYTLYGAETRGPSMNRRWPEGTIIVFTSLEETLESPIPGKRYVVERQRAGGEKEHTVKLLHVDDDGKAWLVPESTDPRFQTPIAMDDGIEGEEVRLLGRVWYAVTRE